MPRPDSPQLASALAGATPALTRIAEEVWALAEISLHEERSALVHVRELEAAGFTVEGPGVAGVRTAFVASWDQGSGGPTIGFLPEYDALPSLGNAAVSARAPREDGVTAGHGCGHNLLGAGCTAAALALRAALAAAGVAAHVIVFGCAAEETEGAKVYLARDGRFGDVDVFLHWHPGPAAAVINARLSATNLLRLEFAGATAHAGNEPWKGRSALDAMELAAHAINQMREHREPTCRMHYVFEAAGEAPNIVPDYARMLLTVRDADRDRVEETTAWIRDVATGAALATQTQARTTQFFGMHDLLPNAPLAERMQRHLADVGVPDWTDDEQAFARACQAAVGVPESGLATSVMPLLDEPFIGGSSDVAEASWIAPTMGVLMPTMPLGVSLHTWPVTACGGMSIGRAGALAAADVLLRTAWDVATDAGLREAAAADHARRVAGQPYVSPLPPDQLEPVGLATVDRFDGSSSIAAVMSA